MVVTDAVRTRRGRIAISVDGEYRFSLPAGLWAESGLFVGEQTDEAALGAVLSRAQEEQAKQRAFSLLSAREYTEKRLTEKLAEKVPREAAAAAAARMRELGLVNDGDYAARLARDLYHLRGFSPKRIGYELVKRGVGREAAEAALSQFEDGDEAGRAAAFLRKKYPDLTEEKMRRRAVAALRRMGYGCEAIRAALAQVRTGSMAAGSHLPHAIAAGYT